MNKSKTTIDPFGKFTASKSEAPVSTKGLGIMEWRIVALAVLAVLAGGGESKLLAAPHIIRNALRHTGYNESRDSDLDLDNNGGLMAKTPFGTAFLTDGPGGRGLDFNNDVDFIDTGAVSNHDNYMNLFFGFFNAPENGDYVFRNAGDDDRCGIWLDLDQDGVFESSIPGLGSNRGEQLSWEDGRPKTVNLEAGIHMFAVTHREGAGGSRLDVRFTMPVGGPEVIIKPSDPNQDGLWTTTPEPATLSLLALGGLAVLRRRRKQ
jgi:hypothetical protein